MTVTNGDRGCLLFPLPVVFEHKGTYKNVYTQHFHVSLLLTGVRCVDKTTCTVLLPIIHNALSIDTNCRGS